MQLRVLFSGWSNPSNGRKIWFSGVYIQLLLSIPLLLTDTTDSLITHAIIVQQLLKPVTSSPYSWATCPDYSQILILTMINSYIYVLTDHSRLWSTAILEIKGRNYIQLVMKDNLTSLFFFKVPRIGWQNYSPKKVPTWSKQHCYHSWVSFG